LDVSQRQRQKIGEKLEAPAKANDWTRKNVSRTIETVLVREFLRASVILKLGETSELTTSLYSLD